MLRLVTALVVLCLMTCDKPIATNKDNASVNLFYSSVSVCSCYKSGMSVLSNLIEYNEQVYKDLFQELRMNCLLNMVLSFLCRLIVTTQIVCKCYKIVCMLLV